MKTIGLLGGMSWESSHEYHRLINEGVRDALGDPHSVQLVLYSVDFAVVERLQAEGRWDEAAELLRAAGPTHSCRRVIDRTAREPSMVVPRV